MADLRLFAATSNLIRFTLKNSSTGQGLTGLTNASSGLIISTIADVESSATAYTVAGATIDTITTLGTYAAPTAGHCRFKEVDSTNHKGLYEFQFADARFAVSNAKRLVISVTGAASLLDADYEIELVQFNPFDAVRLGLTAFPNVASGNAGALLVDGTGTAAISNSGGKVLLQATQAGVTIPTVTTLTNLPSIPANWLTAAGIAAGALNGKGDWLLSSSYPANFGAFSIDASGGVSLTATQNPVLRTATAQGGGATSITLDAGASSVTNAYTGCTVVLVSGTGASAGQARTITAYNGTTKVATVDWAWETNPDATSVFAIRAADNAALNSSLQPTSAALAGVTFPTNFSALAISGGGAVTVGTNNDKSGYSLTQAFPANFSAMVISAGGVANANVTQSAGTTIHNSDGTLASATASTVTFPTTDSAGNAIPDDNRFAFCVLEIVAGTGIGQMVALTTKSGVRTFNILNGTCPVTLDATSQYVVVTNNSQIEVIRTGTAQAGGASTITLDAGASATNNFYQNQVVFILSGTGAGQSALITTYVGTTKVATINGTWATNPDSTSVFALLPFGAISASVAGNVTVGGYAAGQDPGTYILATPSQKLVTNASGFVTFSNTTIATATNLTNLPSIPTNWLTAAGIAAGALNGKGDWLLASSAPTNFGSLAITVGGAVTAGTVSDKTGYSLTQAFPSNFAALSIDANGRVELQSGITKNAALNNFEFLLVSSTDHVTPVTGATVTATRSLDGAAFGACANAVTEVGSGIYKINLAATDTNAGIVTLKMSATGADTRYITLVTTP